VVVLLKPEEVAERLGISTSTLGAMVREGEAPPHLRVASRLRFPESGVDEWIARRTETTPWGGGA
jgi:excisionase family DNA binding protein